MLLVFLADAFQEHAHGRPFAPGVGGPLDLLLDHVELDLLGGERMIGGRGALLFDHRAATLQRVFQFAIELFELRGERFEVVLQSADRVGGEQRREIGLAAVLADGDGDFARGRGALLSQFFRFIELGRELTQLLLVGDAALLEQRGSAALEADRAAGMLGLFDAQALRPLAQRLALFDALLVLVVLGTQVIELIERRNCSWRL